MKYISITLIVVLIFTSSVLIIWKHKKDESSLLLIQTVQPFIANIENKRLIPGNLYPMKEIEVKSSISGTLEKIFVQIGSKVKVGDVIAQVKRVPNPSDIEVAKQNLNAAKIVFESDQKIFDRNKKLYESHIISDAEFEGYQKNYDLSKEQFISTQNQLTLLQEGFTKKQDLSNMVKATTTGTIIDLPLKEGASIIERNNFNDGTNIAVVARLDSFVFKGKVNETDLIFMQTGMKLKLHINAYKTSTRFALLNKISAKGIDEQGVMKYYIEACFGMADDTLRIRSGYTASAEIILQNRMGVMAIEEKNLHFQNDSTFVEILNSENIFEKRYVTIGLSDGINIEIIKGINKNERIRINNN